MNAGLASDAADLLDLVGAALGHGDALVRRDEEGGRTGLLRAVRRLRREPPAFTEVGAALPGG